MDNYLTSVWTPVIKLIEEISGLTYEGNEKSMRIIADHMRTSVFISADPAGIKPSNTDQGYILRRLIRRVIRHVKSLGIDVFSDWDTKIAECIMDLYKKYYSELESNHDVVLEVLANEKVKFNRTLEKGLKEFEKIASKIKSLRKKDNDKPAKSTTKTTACKSARDKDDTSETTGRPDTAADESQNGNREMQFTENSIEQEMAFANTLDGQINLFNLI